MTQFQFHAVNLYVFGLWGLMTWFPGQRGAVRPETYIRLHKQCPER